ncbi:MAG TPA: glycerol-3-phosphate 1-O-acyltransferase PlsY [Patescibacteria group bacterium]|nr:glycerol-3-phosphate 1-O-acyltransferase PlsY [Patescibacteria group bacterium]
MNSFLMLGAGYLLGSIPFGYLIGRFFGGHDIRREGSSNIGATNVARTLGLGAGLATLGLDAGKGACAVWLATRLNGDLSAPLAFAAIGAILGHLFPVWLRCRGGRGVATAIGAFLVIGWMATLADLLVWVVVMAIWRYASLSSILWAALLPLLMYWLYVPGHHPPQDISIAAVIAALLILWRHRPNLERLIEGSEPQMHFRGSSRRG